MCEDHLRLKTNFASRFNAITPAEPLREKYFYFFFTEIMVVCRRPASSKRGVRVVTIRGVRDAMDVVASADGWRRHGR
jgi:hypothetical protein